MTCVDRWKRLENIITHSFSISWYMGFPTTKNLLNVHASFHQFSGEYFSVALAERNVICFECHQRYEMTLTMMLFGYSHIGGQFVSFRPRLLATSQYQVGDLAAVQGQCDARSSNNKCQAAIPARRHCGWVTDLY